MWKAYILLLLLSAVFAVGLSSPIHSHQLQSRGSLLPPAEYAEIEQTVVLDLLWGLAKDTFNNILGDLGPNHPLLNLVDRLDDFLQNQFDPEGSQTAQLKFIMGLLKELLDYLQSVAPANDDELKIKIMKKLGKEFIQQ